MNHLQIAIAACRKLLRFNALGAIAATILLGCAKTVDPSAPLAVSPPSRTASAGNGSTDGGARAPEAPTELHVRSCGRPPYDASWSLSPSSKGIYCKRTADCGPAPLYHCLGFAADCVSQAGELCGSGVIETTICLLDPCARDGDCKNGQKCVCPRDGSDPFCAGPNACDDDGDCASGQSCRQDGSVHGAIVEYCTTPNDRCRASADCIQPGQGCGYDAKAGYWLCRDTILIDP